MSTTDRLRDDIDSGRTQDKVATSDPAAAPLGTDEEAAGTPPSPQVVELARRQELVRDAPHEKKTDGQGAVIYMGIVAIIAALIAGGVLYLAGVR
jgi:cobalamin biosynthesis Mg chelatase CobN